MDLTGLRRANEILKQRPSFSRPSSTSPDGVFVATSAIT